VFSAFAAGWVTQWIGERKVVVWGLVVFGLGCCLLLTAHDLGTC
jgi:MFS transporter, ACDE family, multidrug resistance protein